MLKTTLQCLYKKLNPKLTYKDGSSNEDQLQEGKQTKYNKNGTLPYLIRSIRCTSQLQWITRQQTSVNKESNHATQPHFKPKLNTKGVTKGLNHRQYIKAHTNHKSLISEKYGNPTNFKVYRGCCASDYLQQMTSHLSLVVQQETPYNFFEKERYNSDLSYIRYLTS
jgi:hypothetical protein